MRAFVVSAIQDVVHKRSSEIASRPFKDSALGCALLDLMDSRRQNRTRRFGADESKSAWQAALMPYKRCGKDRAGHNKMPAKGALANGLKMPRYRDVV